MTWQGWLQLAVFAALIAALVKPLGGYITRILDGTSRIQRTLAPVENGLYRLAGVDPAEEQRTLQMLATAGSVCPNCHAAVKPAGSPFAAPFTAVAEPGLMASPRTHTLSTDDIAMLRRYLDLPAPGQGSATAPVSP